MPAAGSRDEGREPSKGNAMTELLERETVEPAAPPRAGYAGRLVAGVVLVVAGLLWLFSDALDLEVGWDRWWPALIVVPGLLILALGLSATGSGREGALVTGAQIAALGGLLAYQNTTGAWATWAYAWALIWPGSIGLAVALTGVLAGDRAKVAAGMRAAMVGFVLFAVGFAFFEGVLDISGFALGRAGDFILPAAVILAGVWLLVTKSRKAD